MLTEQGAVLIAFQVGILIGPQRPDEGSETEPAEEQRHWDQIADNRHVTFLTLSAFRTTTIEEPDIAAAAINGVTWPDSASGMASAL